MGAVPSRGGAALWLGATGQADKHGPTLCAAGAGPCWQQGATNPQSVHDRETEDQRLLSPRRQNVWCSPHAFAGKSDRGLHYMEERALCHSL